MTDCVTLTDFSESGSCTVPCGMYVLYTMNLQDCCTQWYRQIHDIGPERYVPRSLWVTDWLISNALVLINVVTNVVTLRQVQLVLG